MSRNTYKYENRLLTNKVKRSIVWGGKGKDRVTLIKSLINIRDEEGLEGRAIKDLKEIGVSKH